MLEVIKNTFRRKTRTLLTVFGIVVGIFALSVMGSLAEKMNMMIDGGVKYYTGQISIMPKGSTFSGTLSSSILDRIRKIKGVKEVYPELMMLRDDHQESGMMLGMPPMIVGYDLSLKYANRNWKTINMKAGRMLAKGDKGKVVIGYDIAKSERVEVGDEYKVRGKAFEVIGIMDKTMTAPDKAVAMDISQARELFIESQPYLKELKERAQSIPAAMLLFMNAEQRAAFERYKSMSVDDVMTGCSVSWRKGVDPDLLAKRIGKAIPEIMAMGPSDMKKQLEQVMLIFNLIITGSALIALIVGGLSVVNTMTMAVTERTREIGLKKALGARTSDILREYLTEAAFIGFLGGAVGLLLGAVFVAVFNATMQDKGADIFLLTPRLAVLSLFFAAALGTVSGILPSLHAAKLDCVKALREE